MTIYMNWNSLAIKGDVAADKHKNWIALNSFQFGVGRGIGSAFGSGANREASHPSVSEIVVTKDYDDSSVMLAQEALWGEGVTVVIHFVRTAQGGADPESYIEWTLSNVLLSGYSMSSGGDRPSESLSLNFSKFEEKAIGMKVNAEAGQPVSFTFDLETAKKV